MSKLIDHLSAESWDRLRADTEAALELRKGYVDKDKSQKGAGDYAFYKKVDVDVAEPMLRYIHSSMIRHGRKVNITGWDYEYNGYVGPLIRNYIMSASGMTRRQFDNFVSSGLWQLQQNRLIEKVKNNHFLVREWPVDKKIRIVNPWSEKIDYREEKRIAKFANEPVKVSYDAKAIPFPKDITPTALVDYVERVAAMAKKQSDALAKAQARVAELEAENGQLKSDLEKMATDEWELAASRIRDLVGG